MKLAGQDTATALALEMASTRVGGRLAKAKGEGLARARACALARCTQAMLQKLAGLHVGVQWVLST